MTVADPVKLKQGIADVEFTYADEEEWLAVQWSHGMRFMLEMASPPVREQLQSEAFAHLRALKRSDGIPHHLWTLYTIGMK